MTVYVEGQNLAILTNYTGVDPELPYEGRPNLTGTSNTGFARIPGIDNGAYPLARTFLFGLTLNL